MVPLNTLKSRVVIAAEIWQTWILPSDFWSQRPPPIPPVGTTPVNISEVSSIGGISDTLTPISSGKTLTITRFAGGAGGGKASKVSLFEDMDGAGTTLHLIRNTYVAGNNFDYALDVNFVGGDGRSIRMRRERLEGGAKEVAGFWNGFEV